jgi:hypothetical protein
MRGGTDRTARITAYMNQGKTVKEATAQVQKEDYDKMSPQPAAATPTERTAYGDITNRATAPILKGKLGRINSKVDQQDRDRVICDNTGKHLVHAPKAFHVLPTTDAKCDCGDGMATIECAEMKYLVGKTLEKAAAETRELAAADRGQTAESAVKKQVLKEAKATEPEAAKATDYTVRRGAPGIRRSTEGPVMSRTASSGSSDSSVFGPPSSAGAGRLSLDPKDLSEYEIAKINQPQKGPPMPPVLSPHLAVAEKAARAAV